MASVGTDGKIQYKGGEVIPTVNTPEYALAQKDPQSLLNFKAANPGLSFDAQDMQAYNNAGPIATDALSAGATPMKVAAPAPATSFMGLDSMVGTVTQQSIQAKKDAEAKAAADAKLAAEGQSVQADEGALVKRMIGAPTEAGLASTEYNAVQPNGTSVNSAQGELNDINNQILAEQTASRHRIEQLQKAGGSASGIAIQSQAIQKESTSKLADLSVIQLAKQNNFALAKDIADKKIAAQMEDYKNTTDALEFNYKENKELFTKKEDRQYQEMITKRKDEQAKKETELKTISDLSIDALQNGAPADVAARMRAATTPDEAISIGGQYVGSLDRLYKQKQIDKLNADIRKTNSETAANGLPGVTNPKAAQYSQALSVILGSAKFTKDQKASVINAINQGEDPFTVIKNNAKNIMGQTEATTVSKFEVARDQMNDISTLLSKYYANGGKTNIFTGNYEKTLNNLGTVSDPKLVGIATQIASALQIYRNAVSGTAYSEKEGQDIASIFPGINKSQGLNEAIIGGRKAAFDSTIDATYRTALGSTYDDLKKSHETNPDITTAPAQFTLPNGTVVNKQPDGTYK